MSNFKLKIDLQKLNGAFVSEIKGRTATKKCICLPIDEAYLFKGEKGIYLNINATELNEAKYGDTHYLKQSLNKEQYNALTEEQRKEIKILGGMQPIQTVREIIKQQTIEIQENTDDLPF